MRIPNFLISDQQAEELFNSLKPKCRNTGTTKTPSFGNESSFLNSKQKVPTSSIKVLAIDVGGTRTKVCVRSSLYGSTRWQDILDCDNNELKTETQGHALYRMTTELGRRIAESCSNDMIALSFDGVAIVWSNKLKCFPLEVAIKGEVRGVGARVYGSEDGQAYRKGEWWNSDIRDGDDISEAFLKGLQASNIKTPILVVGNDTVFTAKALPGAHAGVVASTGANTTIIPVGQYNLLNSECGGAIEIPAKLLALSKLPACIPGTTNPIKIEDVCAGKGLPLVFQLLISEALAQGVQELVSIEEAIKKQALSSKELAEIVGGQITEVFKSRLDMPLDELASNRTLEIGSQLIHNAGTLCAVLILISVANQLDSISDLLVALDSSQARFVPGYREALDRFLDGWNARNKKQVRYELLLPDGKISVPLRGAANAIEEFL